MKRADLFRGALELDDDDRHDPHEGAGCRYCDGAHPACACPFLHDWQRPRCSARPATEDEPSRCDWCLRPECSGACDDFKAGSAA